jgi:type IV secretory pathway VirB10-like protein
MGATDGAINEEKFAMEIEQVFEKVINMQPTITIEQSAYGKSASSMTCIYQ